MLHGHEGVEVLALLEVLLGGLKSFARIFDERFCVRGAVGAIAHAASAGAGLSALRRSRAYCRRPLATPMRKTTGHLPKWPLFGTVCLKGG